MVASSPFPPQWQLYLASISSLKLFSSPGSLVLISLKVSLKNFSFWKSFNIFSRKRRKTWASQNVSVRNRKCFWKESSCWIFFGKMKKMTYALFPSCLSKFSMWKIFDRLFLWLWNAVGGASTQRDRRGKRVKTLAAFSFLEHCLRREHRAFLRTLGAKCSNCHTYFSDLQDNWKDLFLLTQINHIPLIKFIPNCLGSRCTQLILRSMQTFS